MNIQITFKGTRALRGTDKRGEANLDNIYASKLTKEKIWPDFSEHFRSPTTAGSYVSDIQEIMDYFQKDFWLIREAEVEVYYRWLENKVKQGDLSPGTMAKKIRELHSFADFACGRKKQYRIGKEYRDYYQSYLRLLEKQAPYAKSVPPEHLDRLLEAAQEDLTAYGIILLLYRAGLTSTEITWLRPQDLILYQDGAYASVKGRRELCYLPEDVFGVLEQYLLERPGQPFLFLSSRGNQLNLMMISRLLKRYERKAGIPSYSAQSIRNSCAFTLFAYGADEEQTASRLGVTGVQIRRYRQEGYRENLQREAEKLVKLKAEPPVLRR